MKRADIALLLFIMLCVATFFFRLFWPTQQLIVTQDFGRSDAWHFSFVDKFILSEYLEKNQIPQWIANIGDGFPIHAEGQMGTFFLPNLVIFKLFPLVPAYNLMLAFTVFTAALGMYLWLRLMRISPWVSCFFALTFAFSGPVIAHLVHVSLIQGFTLMPLALALTLWFSRSPTFAKATLIGMTLSAQILTGFPQSAFVTVLFLAPYLFWLRRKSPLYVTMCWLVLIGCWSVILSAIQLVPSKEFLRFITDPNGFSLDNASFFSLPWKGILTFIHPYMFGSPKYGTHASQALANGNIFWENAGYVGILPILFCFSSVFIKQKQIRQSVLFFGLTGVIAILLATGKYSPLYLVYSIWPFNLFRVPSRFIWILVLCILVLGAQSLEYLKSKLPKLFAIIFLCLSAIQIYQVTATWYTYHATSPANVWLTPPTLAKHISPNNRVMSFFGEEAHNKIFLREGWSDVQKYVPLENTFTNNANILWNVPSHTVYAGRFLMRSFLLETYLRQNIERDQNLATASAVAHTLINLASVDTIISTVPFDTASFTPIASTSAGETNITMYRNPDALPNAYLASHSLVARSVEDALYILGSTVFIPGVSVIMESSISAQIAASEATLTIEKPSDTEKIIHVGKNTAQTLLVLTDTFYPGWRATIDGVETQIYPANISQRTVVLPPGDHTVRFFYASKPYFWGALISAVTWILAISVIVFLLVLRGIQIRPKGLSHGSRRPGNRDR